MSIRVPRESFNKCILSVWCLVIECLESVSALKINYFYESKHQKQYTKNLNRFNYSRMTGLVMMNILMMNDEYAIR